MLHDKTNSLENMLTAATGKEAPVTNKNYINTGNTLKEVKVGYLWVHGYGVRLNHDSSMCGS